MIRKAAKVVVSALLFTVLVAAQTGYTPKFPGDPANSAAEAAALGYMRVVVNAQKNYKRKNHAYAASLPALVGKGSFTRRMLSPERGDYTAGFRGSAEKYSVTMTPKQFDPEHRAFYVDETGVIRAEADKPASKDSPKLGRGGS